MPLLALIPLALQLLPQLGRWIAGDTGEGVARAAAGAVQAVTGADTPEAAEAALGANPELRAQLTQRLAEIAAEREAAHDQARLDAMRAELADIANARTQTVALVQAGSWIASMPAVLTMVLVAAYLAVLASLLLGYGAAVDGPWRDATQRMIGGLDILTGGAIAYWLGTSRGAVEMRQGLQGSARPFAAGGERRP